MMECEGCGRLFPEVVGAPTQVCPHCQREMATATQARSSTRGPIPVDPVGAITLAARTGAREYPRLLLIWLPALLFELAAGVAILAYEGALGLPADGTATTGENMQLLGVATPLLFLFFTIRLATWSFVSKRVLEVVLGRPSPPSWGKLVGPAFVSGFVLTLAYMAGALMLLVGYFIVLHWFAFVPTFVARGARLSAAFDESRRFAREHSTFGFTALVAMLLVGIYAGWYALSVVLDGWIAEVAPALLLWITGPLVPLLAASYVALALKGSATRERPAATATSIVRATTKCPHCATLIPYTPSTTGGATDVVCPSCGRAGKVL